MFELFTSWRKSCKCKKLVKEAQSRLKLLKNKRSSMARMAREDMSVLISAGHPEVAFNRVEELCQDETLISTYEVLDQFCESILMNVSYIWKHKHKDIPNDVKEAISSLIFASARCGDLPELGLVRKHFTKRYGQRFVTDALELCPGNLVNPEIIKNLSGKAVADEVKQDLFLEIEYTSETPKVAITKELSLNPYLIPDDVDQNVFYETSTELDPLSFQFATKLQKQEKESNMNQEQDMYLLSYKNKDGAISMDSLPSDSSDGNESSTRSRQSSCPNPGMTNNSQIFHQPSYYANSPSSSSLDGSFRCHEEDLVYLDDKEEVETRRIVQEPRTKQILLDLESPRKEIRAPNNYYRRALTMPVERSVASPYKESPRFVHPKLPDHEEIVLKFMSLKKDANRNQHYS